MLTEHLWHRKFLLWSGRIYSIHILTKAPTKIFAFEDLYFHRKAVIYLAGDAQCIIYLLNIERCNRNMTRMPIWQYERCNRNLTRMPKWQSTDLERPQNQCLRKVSTMTETINRSACTNSMIVNNEISLDMNLPRGLSNWIRLLFRFIISPDLTSRWTWLIIWPLFWSIYCHERNQNVYIPHNMNDSSHWQSDNWKLLVSSVLVSIYKITKFHWQK